ncbi:MAG: DUF5931 domain-containing protein [Kineosporiaceae bacterium]
MNGGAVGADPMRAGSSSLPWDEPRLWRAVGWFRVGALIYAVVRFAMVQDDAVRPWLGWTVLVVMAVWTVVLLVLRPPPASLVVADLVLVFIAVVCTRLVDDPEQIISGTQTLPSMWAAAPVLGWAVWRGRAAGLFAAGVVVFADLVEIAWQPTVGTVYNIVLLVLTGLVVGYAVEMFRAARSELARAVALDAATRERERLAGGIHDSVLQVLAFIKRRAGELGGEVAELGRLAGEEEVRLRALVSSGAVVGTRDDHENGVHDVLAELGSLSGDRVSVAGPAGSVPLPGAVSAAVVGAVSAALDNVRRHAGEGARAWVLVEDEGEVVVVTVRDDGVGIPPGRLAEAADAGRLGVLVSIRGRIAAVGGTVLVVSGPDQGTEVEMRVPRGRR